MDLRKSKMNEFQLIHCMVTTNADNLFGTWIFKVVPAINDTVNQIKRIKKAQ